MFPPDVASVPIFIVAAFDVAFDAMFNVPVVILLNKPTVVVDIVSNKLNAVSVVLSTVPPTLSDPGIVVVVPVFPKLIVVMLESVPTFNVEGAVKDT